MPSAESERVIAELFERKDNPLLPIVELRQQWLESAEAETVPAGTKTSAVQAGGVIAEWVEHPDCDGDGVFLLMHGGGFASGGPVTHRKLASYISQATNMRVLVPDFRLSPEHPFPAGLHDCLAVYGALLSDGVPADKLAIGGDSSGGGLAASMLVALQTADGPMPSSITMMSPWLDLTCAHESYTRNADADPVISKERNALYAGWYYDEADPENPILSPLFADLAKMPPILLQVGEIEVLVDEAIAFTDKARAAGVETELEVWPHMWHVWHQRAPEVPEALEAITKIGDFVKRHANTDKA